MDLPDQAARALDAVRRDASELRFEVAKVCGESRYRLSVRFRKGAADEVRLGLLYSDDRAALEDLRARLAGAP
jgi:hypothetical protein